MAGALAVGAHASPDRRGRWTATGTRRRSRPRLVTSRHAPAAENHRGRPIADRRPASSLKVVGGRIVVAGRRGVVGAA